MAASSATCGRRTGVASGSWDRSSRWDRGRPWRRRRSQADREAAEREAAPAARTALPAGKTREGSKQALLVEMLKRPEGATIAQIVEATGWQPHTVRGAFAGALKKRLGLTVTSEKVEGTRVYHIAADAAPQGRPPRRGRLLSFSSLG